MKTFDIEQLESIYRRMTEKAEVCHRLGAITDYRANRFFENAGSFNFKVEVNTTGHMERKSWEAFRHLYGSDHDYHLNIQDATELDKFLEEAIAGVLADIRTKKEILDSYFNPTSLI